MANLTDGAKIGRALTKLESIGKAEASALAASPGDIVARFAARREAFLAELEPHIRTAVEAASKAVSS